VLSSGRTGLSPIYRDPLRGTVDVRAELAAPAIKIWGFIKVEETLRVFYLYNIGNDDFNKWYNKRRTFPGP